MYSKKDYFIKEEPFYISAIINGIGLIHTKDNKLSGLMDLDTGEIIGNIGMYHTHIDQYKGFFVQTRNLNEYDEIDLNYYPSNERIRIYNTNLKVFDLEECFIISSFGSGLKFVLSDDGISHIYDKKLRWTKDDPYNKKIDDMQAYTTSILDHLYIIRSDNKYGIYSEEKGLIVNTEYDKIYDYYEDIVLEKDGKKYYLEYRDNIVHGPYEDVKVSNGLLLCKDSNGTWYIRHNSEYDGVLEKIDAEDLKCVNHHTSYNSFDEYVFVLKYVGKYGITSVKIAKYDSFKEYKLPPNYDEIITGKYGYILRNNNKYGYYSYYEDSRTSNYLVNDDYDEIIEVNKYCILKRLNGNYSLHKFSKYSSVLDNIKDYKIISNDHMICNTTNGYYLVYLDKDMEMFGPYDSISYINYDSFEIEKNGKYGVVRKRRIIIDMKYNEITYKYAKVHNKKYMSNNYYFFALTNDNNKKTMTRIKMNPYETIEYEADDKEYDDIKFFDGIIALYKYGTTIILNYNMEEILSFNSDNPLSVEEVNINGKICYLIDNEYYFYSDNKIYPVPSNKKTVYISGYETRYATVVVNDEIKESFDRKCKQIERLSEKEIDSILLSYYNSNEELKSEYPNLTLMK